MPRPHAPLAPTSGGWGDGELAAKGELMAGYDVAAELEALLETVEEIDEPMAAQQQQPPPPRRSPHDHLAMRQDDDVVVHDMDELDLELEAGNQQLQTELQAQLAAFDEYASTSDEDA